MTGIGCHSGVRREDEPGDDTLLGVSGVGASGVGERMGGKDAGGVEGVGEVALEEDGEVEELSEAVEEGGGEGG